MPCADVSLANKIPSAKKYRLDRGSRSLLGIAESNAVVCGGRYIHVSSKTKVWNEPPVGAACAGLKRPNMFSWLIITQASSSSILPFILSFYNWRRNIRYETIIQQRSRFSKTFLPLRMRGLPSGAPEEREAEAVVVVVVVRPLVSIELATHLGADPSHAPIGRHMAAGVEKEDEAPHPASAILGPHHPLALSHFCRPQRELRCRRRNPPASSPPALYHQTKQHAME